MPRVWFYPNFWHWRTCSSHPLRLDGPMVASCRIPAGGRGGDSQRSSSSLMAALAERRRERDLKNQPAGQPGTGPCTLCPFGTVSRTRRSSSQRCRGPQWVYRRPLGVRSLARVIYRSLWGKRERFRAAHQLGKSSHPRSRTNCQERLAAKLKAALPRRTTSRGNQPFRPLYRMAPTESTRLR